MERIFATVKLQIEWNENVREVTLIAPWGDKLAITNKEGIDFFFSLKPEQIKQLPNIKNKSGRNINVVDL